MIAEFWWLWLLMTFVFGGLLAFMWVKTFGKTIFTILRVAHIANNTASTVFDKEKNTGEKVVELKQQAIQEVAKEGKGRLVDLVFLLFSVLGLVSSTFLLIVSLFANMLG